MKKNYIYAFLTVLIWSTLATVAKLVLTDIPNLQTLALSSLAAFLFLLIVNARNGSLGKLKNYALKEYGIMAGLGFIGLFVYSSLYYYGLTQLTSQEACILNYLWPMMLVAFSCILLKEKLTAVKGAAMFCSFLGIVLMSAGDGISAGQGAASGMAACIIAAACYGLFSVLNKKAGYDQNLTMNVIWLVVSVCSAVSGWLTEEWVPLHGPQWLGILWLGVFVDAIAYLLWALALQGEENTAGIANLAYLTPFLSLIISAIVLGERLSLRALAALILIVGGILLQSVHSGRAVKQSRS